MSPTFSSQLTYLLTHFTPTKPKSKPKTKGQDHRYPSPQTHAVHLPTHLLTSHLIPSHPTPQYALHTTHHTPRASHAVVAGADIRHQTSGTTTTRSGRHRHDTDTDIDTVCASRVSQHRDCVVSCRVMSCVALDCTFRCRCVVSCQAKSRRCPSC
jgi:hypothetical protein